MKRTVIMSGVLTACVMGMIISCGRTDKAPQQVNDAFASRFPDAKSVKWDMEDAGEWEAEFTDQGRKYSANFSVNGDWLETEHEVDMEALPSAVAEKIKTEFSGYEIDEVELAEKPDGVFYEVALEKGDMEIEVVFDSQGSVLERSDRDEEE